MVKEIKTEKEYDHAIAYLYELMQTDIVENSLAFRELEFLSLLVEKYETINYHMGLNKCYNKPQTSHNNLLDN